MVVQLKEILTESKIVSIHPDSNRRIRVKLNLGGVEKRPDTSEKKGATKYYVRKAGQFIYGKQNLHKGAFGIVPTELDGFESSSDIPAFDIDESCLPEWIILFLSHRKFYLKLEAFAKGIGSKRVNTTQFYELKIPLPSKEDQQGIIDSINKIEEKISAINNELVINDQLLDKLKRAFFQEAISGKLTEGWRSENEIIESGKQLLQRIKKQKTKPSVDSGKKVSGEEIPFNLPSSWVWCNYADINAPGTNVSYGVLIPESHVSDGIPLVRVGDIDGADLGIMPSKYISLDIAKKYKRTQLEGVELLIVVVGASIGKAVMAHPNWRNANIARAVSRTVVHPLVSRMFLFITVQSPYIQDYFKTMTRSVGQPTLNVSTISSAMIPLPPIAEQEAIVDKIQSVQYLYQSLQKQFYSAQLKLNEYSDALKRDILTAFDSVYNQIHSKSPLESANIDNSRVSKFDFRKYNSSIMELEDLLKENGKMSAVSLWQMSKFDNDIDGFYEELKRLVEIKKTVKESIDKGFLELA